MKTPWNPSQSSYPAVRRDEEFTEMFKSAKTGPIKIPDPYHHLADPAAPSTVDFVEKQSAFAKSYLSRNEHLGAFKEKLTKNWNYERHSLPALKGDGAHYYTYNSGLSAQSQIYRTKGNEKDGELFFDPNLLSKDGSVSRSSSAISKDGKYFAYALSQSGSDWTTIYVRLTSSPHSPTQAVGKDEGRLEEDVIRFVKFSSISWTADSLGFFYQRFPKRDDSGTDTESDKDASVYYHRVGTPQSADELIMEDAANPSHMFYVGATNDGAYVVLSTSRDTARSNTFAIAKLGEDRKIGKMDEFDWQRIVPEFGDYYSVLTNDGPLLYFYTNADGASNYKIQTFNLDHPELGFVDLIATNSKALLSSVHISRDKLVLLYSIDVRDELHLFDLKSGKPLGRIGEGLLGSVDQFAGRREDSTFYFSFASFLSPGTAYAYDFDAAAGKELSTYRTTKVAGIDPNDFVSEQVFYTSKDGTKIPMFITKHKSCKNDGTAPVIQYGYGGFSASMEPFFSPSLLTWCQAYHGVFAVCNIRGGGEYGEDWHLAGIKEKKQNVFDDFQYATKYLVEKGIGAKDKIAISGGSNGGLLVGACLNQAPELYGAAIADVGVMDMLRFHRYTVGKFWISDYGDPDDPTDFDYLYAYSPLHNVPTGPIPPVMLLTADHDDRVSPLHSFKYAAELQHRNPNNPHPILLRVDKKAGHGAGKSLQAKIEEAAEKYGFVSQSMGLEFFDD